MFRAPKIYLYIFPFILLGGCGTYVPHIEEGWERVEVPFNMEARIKNRIFCETLAALKLSRDPKWGIWVGDRPVIPDDYGVQMQVTLTTIESSGFNPGLSYAKTYGNSTVSGVTVGNSFTLGLGANLTSTATRTDTMYSYYNVGKILNPQNERFCLDVEGPDNPPHGSSLLLQSNLGVFEFLKGSGVGNRVLISSDLPKNPKDSKEKDTKRDIFSYDVKFDVVTNGNLNPTWKLVNVSANTGSTPLLAAGRTRTHEMVLTFGPGIKAPSEEAIQTHFNGQIVQQLNRIGRAFE